MAIELVKTGKHNVTALTRAGSTSSLPEGVKVAEIDYENHDSIVKALNGQDALIITLGVTAPPDTEAKLVRAAADAGVPWILPNEWGTDTQDVSSRNDTLIGETKVKTQALIRELGKSSFIAVATGFWYEWSLGIAVAWGFDFKARKVTFFDDGKTKIVSSTWPQVGRGVAALLSLPIKAEGGLSEKECLEQFRNGYVYFNSFTLNQEDMFESVLRVTGTKREDWTIEHQDVKERYKEGMEQFKKGDRQGFGKLLYARIFYPDGSGNMEVTRGLSNELLELPKDDMDEATKIAIKRSENTPW